MKERKGYVFCENGKWFARVTFTGSNGKRRNVKRTAKTKTEAKALLKKVIRQIDDEGITVVDVWRKSFNDLADYYEAHYLKPAKFIDQQKVEGLRDVRRVKGFLTHFREYFGTRKLTEITYGDIYCYRSERLKVQTPAKRTRTVASMNRELAYLRRIFNIALRQGWINKNPLNAGETLILNSCERRRERILTYEEEVRLLDACEHPQRRHVKSLLMALLDTGARKGEMLKLAWRDVDFENRLLTIQALNTKTLKTRQVAITERLLNELQRLYASSDENPDSLVFGIRDNVRNSFSTACKLAGIKEGGIDGLTLHCLRHTAATRLVKGQLPIQLVGRILGHTQVNTTYRYLTADTQTARDAVSILEEYQTANSTLMAKNTENV